MRSSLFFFLIVNWVHFLFLYLSDTLDPDVLFEKTRIPFSHPSLVQSPCSQLHKCSFPSLFSEITLPTESVFFQFSASPIVCDFQAPLFSQCCPPSRAGKLSWQLRSRPLVFTCLPGVVSLHVVFFFQSLFSKTISPFTPLSLPFEDNRTIVTASRRKWRVAIPGIIPITPVPFVDYCSPLFTTDFFEPFFRYPSYYIGHLPCPLLAAPSPTAIGFSLYVYTISTHHNFFQLMSFFPLSFQQAFLGGCFFFCTFVTYLPRPVSSLLCDAASGATYSSFLFFFFIRQTFDPTRTP